MTPARAKAVLEGMGLDEFSASRLYDGFNYIKVDAGDEDAEFDGKFTAEELEAIAHWMRDPDGVTNA